jgi:hypothetical protein
MEPDRPTAAGFEGNMPPLDGATAWLNSEPLSPAGLRGRVVAVNFCTYSCINWLRSFPYVRAWSEKYKDHGLVVLGAHTPEFGFEHDVDTVARVLQERRVDYPVAIDNDYAVWDAFANRYWPALYFVDAQGRIRHHHFGEGGYEESERVIQQLLAEAGVDDVDSTLASVEAEGDEAPADWDTLQSPETYLGYDRGERFASPGGAVPGERRAYAAPAQLGRNDWALSGDWTVGPEAAVLNEPGGRIAYRFAARDVHLVMGAAAPGVPVRFEVRLDGAPPGAAHGVDADDQGNGTVSEPRLHQLVRQPGPVAERGFEITFLDPGVRAYVFTFG